MDLIKNSFNSFYSSLYAFFKPKNGTQSFFATRHWVYMVIVPWTIYTVCYTIYNIYKYYQFRKRRQARMEVMERVSEGTNGNIPMSIRHAVIAYALMAIRRIMRVPPVVQ